ncbi:MAG TPA: VOC family protein [Candidatus Limnocylindrales bacterium]|nr:VOC family protein [Candidatus Limnocylindrales bacterium]
MPRRVGFPAGVPAWIETNQPDPDAAAEFYSGLFGWRFDDRSVGTPGRRYLVATLDGDDVAAVGSLLPDDETGPAWNTYVDVEDVDAAAESVVSAGGRVIAGPADAGDLGRVAACTDPAGATFRVLQPGALKGAAAVNAPGTWNFSELNTRDIEGARRFYKAVFGWEAEASGADLNAASVNGADAASLMVRLPGYADFLEQFDPGLRKRHAEFGAPPGFSECVAWILPLTDETATPHWSVTFAVADTDDIVERVRRLGGSVVTEPIDVPPTRLAVVRDPAGAQFTVSAFNPG